MIMQNQSRFIRFSSSRKTMTFGNVVKLIKSIFNKEKKITTTIAYS